MFFFGAHGMIHELLDAVGDGNNLFFAEHGASARADFIFDVRDVAGMEATHFGNIGLKEDNNIFEAIMEANGFIDDKQVGLVLDDGAI